MQREGNLTQNGGFKENFQCRKLQIKLELPINGIYLLGSQGATGKTYLCRQLRRLHESGEAVDAFYAFSPVKLEEVYSETRAASMRLLMFDAFDLYVDAKNVSYLQRLSVSRPVLVDIKSEYTVPLLDAVGYCSIYLGRDRIEVCGRKRLIY